eukprot:TRINITY_DN1547_c0_g1_i1.p1 TRINITY_DN1547_c0_g1~~TRINITY_DN1547_c0_g1_i1.p1  ORF type:complete len:534 (+),score=179.74 TRINITY_DN1547_c0_g1_i1:387-1988(+)
MKVAAAVLLLLSVSCAYADVYMHNPRGSNNRLNEGNNNRKNANRLFDSQNNNRGGYNVGDGTGNGNGKGNNGKGTMQYYVGSIIPVEWTNQHACGNEKAHCQIIMQYACDNNYMRNGETTTAPNPATSEGSDTKTGRHESKEYYNNCKKRERNKGLFIADQKVANNKGATATRQNPKGTRRGLECPEERDYYPYWHPSIWKDVAILTTDTTRCAYYQAESQNVKPKNYCSNPVFNNEADCLAGKKDKKGKVTEAPGTWRTAPAHGIPAPDCMKAPWNRQNHLGNGLGAEPNYYYWTVPNDVKSRCVFRIRYNISTGDYDWNVNWTKNGKENSPVEQNPTVDVGAELGLKLAINTAQFGRTFQDRSHIFSIRARPGGVPASAKIWNLNVRGRRGNIVQNFPSVEYDFTPTKLELSPNDYVHWQWTGSNNNPNNAGEGRARTDRSNVAQIKTLNDNYPMPVPEVTMFENAAVVKKFATLGSSDKDIKDRKNEKLDNVDPYQNLGLMKFKRGTYYYMCTRNNNFSNRSQKGQLIVK